MPQVERRQPALVPRQLERKDRLGLQPLHHAAKLARSRQQLAGSDDQGSEGDGERARQGHHRGPGFLPDLRKEGQADHRAVRHEERGRPLGDRRHPWHRGRQMVVDQADRAGLELKLPLTAASWLLLVR